MTRPSAALVVAMALIAALVALPLAESSSQRAVKVHIGARDPQGSAPDATAADDDPSTSGIQVRPVGGQGRQVDVRFNVDDDNGHNDVRSATVTVYRDDQATQHLAATAGTKSSGSGKRGVWDFSFNMNYWDAPGTYWIKADAQDRDGTVTTQWVNFTYERTAALALSSAAVDLNPNGDGNQSVDPGADTLTSPVNISIYNRGNVALDFQYAGTNLTNSSLGVTIPVTNVWWSFSSDMSGRTQMGLETATETALNLTNGEGSARSIYMAIQVPAGTPAGTYSGSITVAAVESS